MKNISPFKNYFLAAISVSLFAVSFAHAQQIEGKGAITLAPSTSTQNVKVVNTSAEPVPVAVSGTPTVQVGNTAANPALVRDLDRAARQPYRVRLTAPFEDGSYTAANSGLVVPAGKRFVIKYASVIVYVPVGQAVIGTLYAATLDYNFVLNRQASLDGVDQIYTAAQPMEIWLDPGDRFDPSFVRDSTLGTGLVRVTISGYLENLP